MGAGGVRRIHVCEWRNRAWLRGERIAWFTRPTLPTLPDAGAGRANFFGVRDLFGLIWEWVDDFNTAMVTGESRVDTGLERDLFCGSGAAGARDPSDYAAFMRVGFRSSLRASYAVPNLGFRCATDAVAETLPGKEPRL